MDERSTQSPATIEAELARIQAEVAQLKDQAARLEAITLAASQRLAPAGKKPPAEPVPQSAATSPPPASPPPARAPAEVKPRAPRPQPPVRRDPAGESLPRSPAPPEVKSSHTNGAHLKVPAAPEPAVALGAEADTPRAEAAAAAVDGAPPAIAVRHESNDPPEQRHEAALRSDPDVAVRYESYAPAEAAHEAVPLAVSSPAEGVATDMAPQGLGRRAVLALVLAPARVIGWMAGGCWNWLRREGRFWALSIVAHTTAIILVGLIVGAKAYPQILGELVEFESLTVLDPPEMVTVELSATTERGQVLTGDEDGLSGGGGGGYSVSGLPIGHGGSMEGGGIAGLAAEVGDSVSGPAVGLADVGVFGLGGGTLALETGPNASGDPSRVVDSLERAMDNITQEILMALVKGDVLVMWLFDQSESMKDDQKEIRDRFERVYDELGLTGQAKGDALLTSIGSFGKDFMLHTEKPTQNLTLIRAAIDAVPLDRSGYENTFPAIGQMINLHRKNALTGRRQLMLIVVTDESGEPESNVPNLEPAINEAKAAHCPVYFIGREAVFGYPFAHMRWVHPQTGGVHWLPINRGPESADPEQLQTSGFQRRYDAFPSGFGPYEQCRCARETGGIFFLLPSPEVDLIEGEDRTYTSEKMRPYLPDLGPREHYVSDRNKSILRSTLWKVITDLNPYWQDRAKVIEMRLNFSADPQQFAREVQEEQRKAAIYVTYLDAAEKALAGLKSRREQEPSHRWQANYDLLYAQVLAYKVRLFEYGAYLTAFLTKPKPVPLTKPPDLRLGRWDIHNREETITGDLTRGHIEQSAQMLRNVIRDHAGTPWAARAEWELARGFGIELVEVYYSPPAPSSTTPVTVTIPIPKL